MRKRHPGVIVVSATAAIAIAAVCLFLWLHLRHTGARAYLAEGNVFYFGMLDEGSEITHSFPVRNVGTEPLKILRITSGCGCAKASMSMTEIPAGGNADLTIAYRARPVEYLDAVDCFVRTNDPRNAFLRFVVTANVRYRVLPLPESLSFFAKAGSTDLTKEVIFKTRKDLNSPLKVEVVSTSGGSIAAEVVSVKEGSAVRIAVSPDCPVGSRSENVVVVCSTDGFSKIVNIPVYVMLH